MAAVSLKGLCNAVLKGINLTVEAGEVFVILGPSGAGKTTLLHAIAGFEPHRGCILFNGTAVDRMPPHERRVGIVFQDLFLFPHLTVRENLLLGMGPLSLKKGEKEERSLDLLLKFGLESLAQRLPAGLSGGEKQRTALARALASSPEVLLLDEPLASLDADSAKILRKELKKFQRDFQITTLLVTHDPVDAFELGDRIGVIRSGELVHTGTVLELGGLLKAGKAKENIDWNGA